MKKFFKDFKSFISKGNVMDLAIGVIIGGAFSNIITSIVNDLLMPIFGIILGGIDFTKLTIKVKDVTINYGNFIQNVINFLIIAFCIFVFIRILNKFLKKKEEEQKKEIKEDIKLLEEIRDLLKNKK